MNHGVKPLERQILTSGSGLCRPLGPKSPGSKKSKFKTPIDPSGVVTNGWKVKNCTGYCYRRILSWIKLAIMSRILPEGSSDFWLFFFGGKPLPRSCRDFFVSKIFVFLNFFRPDFFRNLFCWSFFYFKA